jgi:hypothetical protein
VLANGQLNHNGTTGSIHAVGRAIRNAPCNGWEHWYYEDEDTSERLPVDVLRAKLRKDAAATEIAQVLDERAGAIALGAHRPVVAAA